MSTAQVVDRGFTYMQGIAVPATSVRPAEFMALTRRQIQIERSISFAGLGNSDLFELKKTGIVTGYFIKFSGSLVLTPGTGTVATTSRWPYDMLRGVRFTANGQTNLINVSGLKLKAREVMSRGDFTDRGVSRTAGATTFTQGTLSLGSENWGVPSNGSALAAGTYPVELFWYLPVAEDEVDMAGAIFAQTSSTDLTIGLDYELPNNLFVLTGNATAALTGTITVQAVRYSIPIGPDGEIIVPDLSTFHALTQTRVTGLAAGDNEIRIVGQGAGKNLLRIYYQVWTGTAPSVAPLQASAANFGRQAWRYAGNETPDEYLDGQMLREVNERWYDADLGSVWGFLAHDFAIQNALRDAVDEGTTSELRILINLPGSPQAPFVEHVREELFRAGAGA